MDMRTALDVRDDSADRAAIFDEFFIFRQIAQSHFVTQRNVADEFDFSSGFPFEGNRADGGTFFQILNGDTDIVLRFM